MNMNDFKVKLELRIDWSEIDIFGHINNLSILKYIQSARVNYMEKIGLMQSQREIKIGPILASTKCQFRKPLFYPGTVTVFSKVDGIKNTSFLIHHEILNEVNELIADAQDIIVLYDFNKNTKHTLPEDLRMKLLQ